MGQILDRAFKIVLRTCLLRFGRVEKLDSHLLQTCKVGSACDLRWCATSASSETNFLLHLPIVHIFAWNVFRLVQKFFPSMLESLFNKSSTLTRLYFEDIMRAFCSTSFIGKLQDVELLSISIWKQSSTILVHRYFVNKKFYRSERSLAWNLYFHCGGDNITLKIQLIIVLCLPVFFDEPSEEKDDFHIKKNVIIGLFRYQSKLKIKALAKALLKAFQGISCCVWLKLPSFHKFFNIWGIHLHCISQEELFKVHKFRECLWVQFFVRDKSE